MAAGQGQGGSTPRKEEGFRKLFLMILRVTKNMPVPFWYLDLNAGSGFNSKAQCDGSPVVFLQAAEKVSRPSPVHARFCDIDPDTIAELRGRTIGFVQRLFDGSSLCGCETDNAAFLERAAEEIRDEESRPELAMGTVLCDPNGFPDGCPVDALDAFFAYFRRIDFILNLNISLFARVRGCLKSENEAIRKGFLDWPTLAGLLERFHKEFWFVRNPSPGGRERFVTFYGHNTKGLGRDGFLDFFPLNSGKGHTVVHNLQRVNPDQGFLFKEME